ncbi:hypothetical protein F5Y19DRAFT_272627 [Xylariaceae sp. FL1651]|nr:hypothetical protein F5Y19DRAFT_272627 [Xylariaceae sp. FL1651]
MYGQIVTVHATGLYQLTQTKEEWQGRAAALWQQVLEARNLSADFFEAAATASTIGTDFQVAKPLRGLRHRLGICGLGPVVRPGPRASAPGTGTITTTTAAYRRRTSRWPACRGVNDAT